MLTLEISYTTSFITTFLINNHKIYVDMYNMES